MTTDLRKVAIVSNAGCPPGRAIALALARSGYHIVLLHHKNDIRLTELMETVCSIEALNLRAAAVACALDGSDHADALLTRSAESLKVEKNAISCIVTVPDDFGREPARHFPLPLMDRHMHANLGWPLQLANALHALTPDDAQSSLICLVDQAGLLREGEPASYVLSQSAMHAAIPMLARSLAPRMRVAAIAATLDDGACDSPDQTRVTPEEIAAAVCFAVKSPAMTGATLLADGGRRLTTTA